MKKNSIFQEKSAIHRMVLWDNEKLYFIMFFISLGMPIRVYFAVPDVFFQPGVGLSEWGWGETACVWRSWLKSKGTLRDTWYQINTADLRYHHNQPKTHSNLISPPSVLLVPHFKIKNYCRNTNITGNLSDQRKKRTRLTKYSLFF